MAHKNKDLSGGMVNLFGNRSATPAQKSESAVEETPATPQEEEDLLNSIEDEQLREALRQKQNSRRGRPRKDAEQAQRDSALYTRATFVVSRELLGKMRAIGYRETLTIKEVMEQAMRKAVKDYEKINGPVMPLYKENGDKNIFEKS